MVTTNEVTADWIFRALVRGRMAEKLEAQRLLESSPVKARGDAVRRMLLDALAREYSPEADEVNSEARTVRCWLLGALGRVPGADGEPEACLHKHLDRTYETGFWARYWALEALVRRAERNGDLRTSAPKELLEACRKLANDQEEDVLPGMLAVAVLASGKGSAERDRLQRILASSTAPDSPELWAALRALRIVFLPFAVARMCSFIDQDNPKFDDATYDAIVALGNVDPGSSEAQKVCMALSRFIQLQRKFQFWDSFRIRAIESIGRLGQPSPEPLLVEELADYNPAVAREAALSLELIGGARRATARVMEALRREDRDLERLARGLREMRDRDGVVAELESAMTSREPDTQLLAQRLLSEMGGVAAFEKLRNRTRSTEQSLSVLERADDRLRTLFEATIADARTGFKIVIGMDLLVFVVGMALITISVGLALRQDKPLDSLSSILTGAGGLVAVVYGRFIARPRAQVEASVQYLSGLKAVFLGYLRQLRQTDQAYTRRVLEDEKIEPAEVEAYNAMIDRTMGAAMAQLQVRPPRTPEEVVVDQKPPAGKTGSGANNGRTGKAEGRAPSSPPPTPPLATGPF